MKIGINTLALLDSKAGAERYAENIIKNIAKIDRENEYFLYLTGINSSIYGVEQENFKKIIFKIPSNIRLLRVFWEQAILPLDARRKKLDLLFSPTNIAPVNLPCPSVVMIFDLHWFVFEELFDRKRLLYIKQMITRSAKNAEAVLTLSESSKRDIVKYLNVSEDKITVTYCGAAERENTDGSSPLSFKYILSVGQIHKRKNFCRLVEAFKLVKERGLNYKLVIIGRPGDGTEELEKLIKDEGLKEDLIWLGYVEDKVLEQYYSHASLLVYPSLYEGFGLPPLEAMARGVPVIASRSSSIPEVIGKAGVLIDPENVNEMAESIIKVLTDEKLAKSLSENGLKQAEKFTWQECARRTLDVFQRVHFRTINNHRRTPMR